MKVDKIYNYLADLSRKMAFLYRYMQIHPNPALHDKWLHWNSLSCVPATVWIQLSPLVHYAVSTHIYAYATNLHLCKHIMYCVRCETLIPYAGKKMDRAVYSSKGTVQIWWTHNESWYLGLFMWLKYVPQIMTPEVIYFQEMTKLF